MPRLPKGVVRRGQAYYLRQFGRQFPGGERWIPLGSDLPDATLRAAQVKAAAVEAWTLPTFEAFAAQWLAERIAPKRSPYNLKMAGQRMRDHVYPELGARLLAEITPADLRRLVVALQAKTVGKTKRPLASRTLAHILSDVRCCFRYATEEARLLTRSPWVPSLMPVIQEEIPDPLSDIELMRAFEACPASRRALFQLALLTGLRYGELRALEWSHVIDGEEPYLLIQRSHERARTKSAKVRAVPLLADAVALLARVPRTSRFLFPGRSEGGRIAHATNRINDTIAAVVPGFHMHRLRHTFACRFLAAGGRIEALQRILGHASVVTTERYARLFRPDVLDAMRALPEGWLRVALERPAEAFAQASSTR